MLLTLVEQWSRFKVFLQVETKMVQSVEAAIRRLSEPAGKHFSILFKSIIADNGFQFTNSNQRLAEQVAVYFDHPYASTHGQSALSDRKSVI